MSAIKQLVDMGASLVQARAALLQFKDVMQAAEKIFDGKFDHIKDTDDMCISSSESKRRPRPTTPDEDGDLEYDVEKEGEKDEDHEEEGDVSYVDYDYDFESPTAGDKFNSYVDPYSGIFFSKDRREEVIEVEEVPDVVEMPEINRKLELMTQGQWMKGCPEGGEQSFLFSLYSQLSDGICPCPNGCGRSIARRKSDFFTNYPNFSLYIQQLRKQVHQTCVGCNIEYCFACGERFPTDKATRLPTASVENPLFHCSNLQGVILGVGLFMLEQMFSDQNKELVELGNKDPTARVSKRRKTDFTNDNDEDDSVYYTAVKKNKRRGGVGYAGDHREDHSGQMEAQAMQRAKDEKISNLLSAIRLYLPNLCREGGGQTSDYLVHPTTLAHLRRRFNYICSSLLRNDSLTDMSDRSVLFFELLRWLETISNHEALASMMAMPIMVVASVKSVPLKRSTDTHVSRERMIVYEGSSGPRELLEVIVIQARAALKGLEGVKPAEPLPEELSEEQKRMTVDTKGKSKDQAIEVSDENKKMIDFCNRILATANAIDRSLRETKGSAFVDRLHASLPKLSISCSAQTPVEAGSTEESAKKAYIEWATRVRFEYCDLTLPHAEKASDEISSPQFKFFFDNEARMLANSDIPKRSLAIAKELAILTTNLPVAWDSSIFLRVDESRVDVIKVLITGPEGTPYYNGCFLFDIFLGPSYNLSPPSVKYMTTNGGKYRFNPNLYADGKVCLSLLGTWSGPGWVSGKSTLLQVLISIQSMILCDEPYLNEPGWASSAGTPQSRAYSANVRRMVVKTAMLGNLKNPPEPFENVIHTHFRLKARSITRQLDEWVSKDDGKSTVGDGAGHLTSGNGSGSGVDFRKDVEELKGLLTVFEADSTKR